MSRLTRTFAGFGLALLASNAGCHNVREEVPPHHKFRNDGKADSAVEFSTQPHEPPISALGGSIGGAPSNAAQGGNTTNSAASPGNAYANLTTGNKFGGTGTSGLGQAPSLMDPPSGAPSTYPPQPPARTEIPSVLPNPKGDPPSPF